MANGHGGIRAGAGRPKGTRKGITAGELRDQFEKTCGISFEEMIAETGRRLYQDFLSGKNEELWVKFSNNVSRWAFCSQPQTILFNNSPSEKSDEEIEKRIRELAPQKSIIEVVPFHVKDDRSDNKDTDE